MNSIKYDLVSFLKSNVYWIIAGLVFFTVRFHGTSQQIDWITTDTGYFVLAILSGFIFAVLSWSASRIIDRTNLRKRSYGFLLILHAFVILLGIILVIFISRIIAVSFGTITMAQVPATFIKVVLSADMLAGMMFTGAAGALYGLIRQFKNMVGPQVFVNLIKGKYYHPQVEERIFMFLDLRSSTTYAEKLGHINYSRLIQDCFSDLTDSAIKHKVEIYQYIGDEAVLSWIPETGIENNNCLSIFYEFKKAIESRKEEYLEKYDLVPEFKAGLNIGKVTVAQVGVLRRQIAYHSEVLNIAARIQGQCNTLKEDLLISERLYKLVKLSDYHFESKGHIPLRGKSKDIELFAVSINEAEER